MDIEKILALTHLERIGYLNQIRQLAMMHTCSVYWSIASKPLYSQIINSGTMFFLRLNNNIIGVTNFHVYQGYLKDLKKFRDDGFECQIGGVRIQLEECIISIDEESDLATFNISEILFNQSGGKTHSTKYWPTEKGEKGEQIICGGYPGNRRTEKIGKVENDFVSFIGQITSINNRYLSIKLDLSTSVWPQGNSIGLNPDLGGISGGPVYRYISSPIERLEIIGFIYENWQSEVLFASHANLILENGMLITNQK